MCIDLMTQLDLSWSVFLNEKYDTVNLTCNFIYLSFLFLKALIILNFFNSSYVILVSMLREKWFKEMMMH